MFPFRIWKMNHNEKCFLKSDGFQRKNENGLNTYLPTHTSVRYSIDLMGKMYVRLYDLSCLCFKSNLRMYLSDILPICVCVCEYRLFSCRFNVRYLVLKVPGWPAERKKTSSIACEVKRLENGTKAQFKWSGEGEAKQAHQKHNCQMCNWSWVESVVEYTHLIAMPNS